MKRITTIVLLTIITAITHAQNFNSIPPGTAANKTNGWHKYIDQGATFDVEIFNKKLKNGNIIWFDQSKYSGSMAGDVLTGKGTYTWANGQRYEGCFKANQKHGWGTMYYKDGTKHIGKWKYDTKTGKGKYFDANGKLLKTGKWKNNTFINKQ